MIFCVLAAGKSCVAIPKLHNHVLAADSSSFSLSSKLLPISSTFVWAPEAKGRVNSTPAGERYQYSYQSQHRKADLDVIYWAKSIGM